jgi:hypothetical protein
VRYRFAAVLDSTVVEPGLAEAERSLFADVRRIADAVVRPGWIEAETDSAAAEPGSTVVELSSTVAYFVPP